MSTPSDDKLKAMLELAQVMVLGLNELHPSRTQYEVLEYLVEAELKRRATQTAQAESVPAELVCQWFHESTVQHHIDPDGEYIALRAQYLANKAAAYGRQQVQQTPLTEDQIVTCIANSGCLGTVRLSCESGPYCITRPSLSAEKLVRAIERAHGIQPPTGAAK